MNITIDGRSIQADGRLTLMEIARRNGIPIPSLCEHPHLKPFTGCRLCLVEVKGRKDFAPACGTYPEEGMEVTTVTPDLQDLRRGVLELILSEHPYACLICEEKPNCEDAKATIRKVGEVTGCILCPQNGRCDLQEIVAGLGVERVGYPALYRNVDVRKEDPFFDRDANTCILCGKCIRVCEEIRGASVLTFVFRGSQTVVGTALDRSLLESGCQFCGACVDICPTSALVERAVRPQVLPETMAPLVCPFCSQGCELEMGSRKGRALFTRPASSGNVNRGQACVRGRFLVRGALEDEERIREPWIRKDGALVPACWEEALDTAAVGLKESGAEKTGLAFGRQIPLEDGYMLFKFAREAVKTDRIFTAAEASVRTDLRRLMEKNATSTSLDARISDIAEADLILVFGDDLPAAHPMAWLRTVEALEKGAGLILVGSPPAPLLRHATVILGTRPGEEARAAESLSRILLGRDGKAEKLPGFEAFRKDVSARPRKGTKTVGLRAEDVDRAAGLLAGSKSSVILFDHHAARGPARDRILASIWNLGLLSGARLFPLGSGSNDRGIFELERQFGSADVDRSFSALGESLRKRELTALHLVGAAFDPGQDRPKFLVVQDTHWSAAAKAADIVLPAAAFAEADGALVNTEGRLQMSRGSIEPPGSAKPDREIVAALARRMGAKGFELEASEEILKEIGTLVPGLTEARNSGSPKPEPPPVPGKAAGPRFLPLEPPHVSQRQSVRYPFVLSVRISGDVYRSFEAAEKIQGLGRLRPSGLVFLNPTDLARIGATEGEELEIISRAGNLEGKAGVSSVLTEGTAEATLTGAKPGEWTFIAQGIVRVDIRRKNQCPA